MHGDHSGRRVLDAAHGIEPVGVLLLGQVVTLPGRCGILRDPINLGGHGLVDRALEGRDIAHDVVRIHGEIVTGLVKIVPQVTSSVGVPEGLGRVGCVVGARI